MEEWRDIPGYEGYYQVSNYGRVKSIERVVNAKAGKTAVKKGKILKELTDPRGYASVTVALSKNCKVKRFIVARLVATVFIINPSKLPIVMHIDDNPSNNHTSNLKWGTHKDNIQDALKKGRFVSNLQKTKASPQ